MCTTDMQQYKLVRPGKYKFFRPLGWGVWEERFINMFITLYTVRLGQVVNFMFCISSSSGYCKASVYKGLLTYLDIELAVRIKYIKKNTLYFYRVFQCYYCVFCRYKFDKYEDESFCSFRSDSSCLITYCNSAKFIMSHSL